MTSEGSFMTKGLNDNGTKIDPGFSSFGEPNKALAPEPIDHRVSRVCFTSKVVGTANKFLHLDAEIFFGHTGRPS
jgi:hypothetical protein